MTDDQRAAADAVRGWAARSATVTTTRAQEQDPAAWRGLWPDLAGLGVFAMALPEDSGGLGGSVADLGAVLEQIAAAMVPGPVLTTALAGLLLARRGPGVDDLSASIADGSRPVGFCASGAFTASADGDGWSLRGSAPAASAGGSDLLVRATLDGSERWLIVGTDQPGAKITDRAPADLSRPVAEVLLDGVHVPAGRVLANVTTDDVDDLLGTLAAAEAAGIAHWCLTTAVDYAKVREQFGRPIGAFQAIKHLCASMLCQSEVAAALAWDAANAADDDTQRPIAAAAAGALAFDAAVEVAKNCIQVLGGIGFTWEHDAHLYLRRALALRQLVGGSGRWKRRVTALSVAGTRRRVTVDLGDREADRARVRATAGAIPAHGTDEQRGALVDAGYLTPHWPAPYGLDADAAEQILIEQELAAAGVTRPDLVIAGWAIPTILQYGTPRQIERFVEPTQRGEITWCQLFSEPGAGSDLASLRTSATKVDGGWTLSGQKVWTSLAHKADWAICQARTDPTGPKHKGISYFLVDMKTAGLDIRPLREITGDAMFNEVFLDDVFVPDDLLVGELNGGWTLARATLANERVAMGSGSSIGEEVERLLERVVESGRDNDAVLAERLGTLVADGLAGSLLDLRTVLRRIDGLGPGPESSVRKLVGVRHRQDVADLGYELTGSSGLADGDALHDLLLSRCLSIAGGTTQVLLSLAAERILGLPRG